MGSLFSLADLEYMFYAAIRNGSVGTIGAKGDPGGWTYPTDLGASNLDTIVAPGMYKQNNVTNVTLANNYPMTNTTGFLDVWSYDNTNQAVVQKFQPFNTAQINVQGYYIRRKNGASFSPWVYYSKSRVDQTAGRAIYQWDDVNAREQLIYGDTGWRDISSLLVNGWTGTLQIRRTNQTVSMIGTLNGTNRTTDHFLVQSSILGFRSQYALPAGTAHNVANETVKIINSDGVDMYITAGAATSYIINANYIVLDGAWPTTLPGTAIGTIPYQ